MKRARALVCVRVWMCLCLCVCLCRCVWMCAQARVYVRVCVFPFLQNTDNHRVSDLRHQEVILIQIRKEKKHSTTPPLPEPSKPNQTHRPLKEFVVHLTKRFRITRFLVKGESITPKKRHSTAHRTCPWIHRLSDAKESKSVCWTFPYPNDFHLTAGVDHSCRTKSSYLGRPHGICLVNNWHYKQGR